VFGVLIAHIAQSVEHFLGKEEVTGSIPVMSSSIVLILWCCGFSVLYAERYLVFLFGVYKQ
jgi:hypothetical protein